MTPPSAVPSVPVAPLAAWGASRAVLQGALLRHRRLAVMMASLLVAVTAFVLAVALRFDLQLEPPALALVMEALPLLAFAKMVGFAATGLFSGWWRHVGLRDLEAMVKGNVLGSLLFLLAVVFGPGLAGFTTGFPRSIFLLDLILCTLLMAGGRIAVRLVRERHDRPAVRRIEKLVLIVGAGTTGIRLLEEIEGRTSNGIAVVGFVDDDPAKQGVRVDGTPVVGTIDDLPRLLGTHEVHEVLVAIPSATGATMRRVVQHCAEARVRHRVVPSLSELVGGRVMYTQMRDVKVEDLLAREPVRLDLPLVHSLIADRTVLVTGAAGSIGSELCRQVAVHQPARLVVFDRHENGMFLLERELLDRFPGVEITPILGDILLDDQVAAAFAEFRPEIVFHAAAYKHVPLAEQNLLQAIRNNVFGTQKVAQAALAHGARDFVLVSTDKAVRPSSVMGATKRAAELVVRSMNTDWCRLRTVRFGNVLGSSGSVVPLFREQIARGGPVTVTDPEVTRYFMTIPEACQLILEAAATDDDGDVFLLEMGQPVRIVDLARQLIRLSGFVPDEDVPIVFTGLRPGEKLAEELLEEGEGVMHTAHERIRCVRTSGTVATAWLHQLHMCVRRGDTAGALRALRQAVPAFTPSADVLARVEAATPRGRLVDGSAA